LERVDQLSCGTWFPFFSISLIPFSGVLRALLFAMVGRPSHRPRPTYGSFEQGELERLRAAADEIM